MSLFSRLAATSLLSLCFQCLLLAQLDRGSLTGSITDPQGAAIANAGISVRNEGTNTVTRTNANSAGQWQIPNLPNGNYEVTVEAAGFRREIQRNVKLGATEVVRVDTPMTVGASSESVEVRAEVSPMRTDTPETGAVLESKQFNDVPLPYVAGRVLDQLSFKIMPGVNGVVGAAIVNGSTIMSRDSLVDGATITTYRGGDPRDGNISPEAIQEYKVQTSGMSAEYGRTQTSVFNYVMKSGSNALHGSAFGSLRNEDLNANTFANKARGIARPLDRKQDVAGSFGGPVYIPRVYDGRNKTFFFTSYELYRERTPGVGAPSVTVPVPEFYQGDFSRLLGAALPQTDALDRPVYKGAIYDPATFRQLASGRWIGDMFPGNRIPLSRMSAVSQKINALAQKYYSPAVRDATGQFALVNNASWVLSSTPQYDTHHFSVKMDHAITDSSRLSGSFVYRYAPKLAATGNVVGSQLWNTSFTDGGPLSPTSNQLFAAYLARIAHDDVINPRLLNHVTLFYNREVNPFQTTHSDIDPAKDLGLAGLQSGGVPGINWGGGPFVTQTPAGGNNHYFQSYISFGLMDSVSFSTGRHFMKAGIDLRRYHFNGVTYPVGSFTFSPAATAIPNEVFSGNQTGYAFASYLLGIVNNASVNAPYGYGIRQPYYGFFFQDDFKVSARLTLNLGLRWEYEPRFHEAADRLSTFDLNAIDPKSNRPGAYVYAGSCNGCSSRSTFGDTSWKQFGPRIGFAYRLTGKTTVRGAYGIFYEGTNFNAGFSGSVLGLAAGSWNTGADPVNPWRGIFNWDQGFPQGLYSAASVDPSFGSRITPVMLRYGPSPYTQQWNFTVQREIFKKIVFEAAYIGNKSTRLHAGELERINQLPASALQNYGRNLTSTISNAADAAKYGVTYPYPGFVGTVASALRPYPQVRANDTISSLGAPLGFSTYNGLQLSATKQFGSGLTFNVNYTWTKTLSNVFSSTPGENGSRPLDYYNLKLEKSIMDWDYPWTVKAFVSYDLPFGRGKRFLGNAHGVANALASGWQVAAIVNYLPGLPLTFAASNPLVNGWNGATNRPNILADVPKTLNFSKSTFNLLNAADRNNALINKAAFSDPGPLKLGNAAPHYTELRNFKQPNEDISVLKNFWIKEGYRIQLRAEALNAFNRSILGGIVTDVTNPLFGQVTNITGNRQLQLGMRFDF